MTEALCRSDYDELFMVKTWPWMHCEGWIMMEALRWRNYDRDNMVVAL